MAKINVDGQELEFDDLSNEAKSQIVTLQFVQQNLKRLEAEIAVHKTAEIAYKTALKNALDKE